jgi:hypothetical protein
MRILRAFAWLRWRVLMNSLERSGARDKLERFSLAIEQLGPIVTALLMIPSAIMLAGAGGYSGWALAQTARPLLFEVLRFLLLTACVFTILGPLLLPAGDRTNAVRLLLLPISRPLLYVAQAATTLTDPWVALVVPAVAALPVGLAIAGAWTAAIVAAVAAILFMAVLIGISSLATSLIHLMVRDRRRGEIAALLFMLVLPMLGLFPGLMSGGDHRTRAERQEDRRSGHDRPSPAWIDTLQRRVLPVVPSEMFVRSTRAAAGGETAASVRSLAGLALGAVLVHAAGLFVFGRVLDSPASAGSRRRTGTGRARTWRIPALSAAASAVAVNQVRLALRTPRGLSILLSPPVVFVMFSLMMSRGGSSPEFGLFRLGSGLALAIFGCWISLLAILPLAMNQFAIDRAGLTLAFLSPLDDRDLLRGKAVGNGIIIGLPSLVCVAGSALFFRAGAVALWISVPVGLMATYMLVAPLGAALSAVFPRAVDLNSIGRGSNAHGLAGFVGFVALTAAGALSLGLALLTINILDRPSWTPLVMAAWCATCAVISHVLFVPVRALLSRRRENLALLR